MDTKKKKLILALFISFLMITSIAGFVSLPEENNPDIKKYKGLEFSSINNKWVVYVNNNPISLSFDPESLEEQKIINPKQLNQFIAN